MTATAVRPEDCLSRHDGDQTVEGLDGPVRIVRDRWGIPHIEATSTHDAFFGQGYCLGQDRLWQLELFRAFAWGTGAALIGRGLLGRDRQNRRLGFGRLAEREWEAQTPEARMILEAYAAGINAAIAANPAPYEFHVLDGVEGGGEVHEMAPWRPVDSLAILKMVSSGGQWSTKLTYAKVAATLGVEAVAAMISDLPRGAALITPSGARWTQETHPYAADVEAAMGAPDGVVTAGGGSNCWVIHGSKTSTGRPIVCGDPHLAIGIPAQWYVVHMQCPEFTAAGPCSPGYPGPAYYGHNTKVAWTMTHSQGDRWDLYRERIRQGAGGPEAEFRGEWAPLTRRDETFEVRGGEPERLTVWETRHGPVIAGDPEADEEVVAARWGLAEPAHDIDAVIAALRADDVAQAREAFRLYDSLSGNFCFSDQDGDIAYQYVGRIPKRPAYPLPVPGWSGEYEWDGDVPKDQLPVDENPDTGFIITANNRTTDESYPHYLSMTSTRFRADRLHELFDETELFSLDEMPALQADVVSVLARELAEHLTAFEASDARARELQQLLRGWDGAMAAGSAAAAACAVARDRLAALTVDRYYGPVEGIPPLQPQDHTILLAQLSRGSELMLGEFGSWQAAMEQALCEASEELRERQGDDPAAWRWSADHEVTWRHNLGRDPALTETLNLPPIAMLGDRTTVWNAGTPVGATGMHGVTYRQILDLGDLNAARICIPPGNSGQPGSPHYDDHVEDWLNVRYHPLFVEWDDIMANAEAELRLTPA